MSRKNFLLFLALVMVASANLYNLAGAFRLPSKMADTVTQAEQRLSSIKPLLPKHGVLSYRGDPREQPEPWPYPMTGLRAFSTADPFPNPRSSLRFVFAQYAVAPLVLVHRKQTETAIGDFYTPVPDAKATGYRIVREFSDGVCLLEKAPE